MDANAAWRQQYQAGAGRWQGAGSSVSQPWLVIDVRGDAGHSTIQTIQHKPARSLLMAPFV
jgi:hypothetical protein